MRLDTTSEETERMRGGENVYVKGGIDQGDSGGWRDWNKHGTNKDKEDTQDWYNTCQGCQE